MKVSILGATGYAGAELVKLMLLHPKAEIVHITSERSAGKKFSEVYPHFRNIFDTKLERMEAMEKIGADSDFIFICLPHGHAMKVGKALAHLPVRILDLGADYRFADTEIYEAWYHVAHTHKNAERVYGLAELERDNIKDAKIIGNAGCYTTASILALAPLAEQKLIDVSTIVIDAKSGVSGAGRKAGLANHFPEECETFRAYGACNHRHTPEIEQAIGQLAGESVILNFTPHLVPMARGILSTVYAKLKANVGSEEVSAAFQARYGKEPFIRLLGEGAYPNTKEVRGSNYCDIAWHIDPRTHRVIVFSAIDNLVKGAAGQAVQNFNIACGFEEGMGLTLIPMYP